MRLIAIMAILGILLFGCTQAPNAAADNATAPGMAQPPAAPPPATAPGTPTPNKAPPPGMENVTAVFTIHIKNFAFEPSEVTVPSGAKVVWVNDDGAQHIIKAAGFESAALSNGAAYEHVFSEPGDYPYSCGIHPSMQGKITVSK